MPLPAPTAPRSGLTRSTESSLLWTVLSVGVRGGRRSGKSCARPFSARTTRGALARWPLSRCGDCGAGSREPPPRAAASAAASRRQRRCSAHQNRVCSPRVCGVAGSSAATARADGQREGERERERLRGERQLAPLPGHLSLFGPCFGCESLRKSCAPWPRVDPCVRRLF